MVAHGHVRTVDHSMGTTDRKVSLTERLVAAGIAREAFTIAANGGTDMVYLTDRTSPQRFDLLRRMRGRRYRTLAPPASTGPVPRAEPAGRRPSAPSMGSTGLASGGRRTGDLVVTQLPGGAFTDGQPTAGGHGAPTPPTTCSSSRAGGRAWRRTAPSPANGDRASTTPRSTQVRPRTWTSPPRRCDYWACSNRALTRAHARRGVPRLVADTRPGERNTANEGRFSIMLRRPQWSRSTRCSRRTLDELTETWISRTATRARSSPRSGRC